MQTYFLKFKDIQEAEKVLLASGAIMQGTDEEGNTVLMPVNNNAIDDVGVISKGGEWDAEGNVITMPTVLSGYHVNLRFGCEPNIEDLQEYIMTPATPTRDFF